MALLRDLQHKKRKAIAVTRAAKQRRIRLKTGKAFKGYSARSTRGSNILFKHRGPKY
ncbi:hypothetical protein DPMN_153921 [Dreissena polymorpha]|uniref:Uncharacterized protein n=1 Tax=Dreissena polymorpha TaxID=45954 RepID=A0A9D4FK12_DREPO|nr:hypothetical protein DPMN_153921 [Dreissena polymorpha]